jgi:sialate O-acetylesterase
MKKNKLLAQLICMGMLLSAFTTLQQDKPTLYIIGDSTVRNAMTNGQWGWGSVIGDYLDSNKISVSNQAMAGRSTRTFIKEQRWDKVLSTLKKGDYVMMQFGHNEGSKPDTSKAGYRGVLRGVGDDSVSLTWPDGSIEIVHSYGWYLKKFITDTKAKGATPIVCSMIPRNEFKDGKVLRADKDYGKWAKETAIANGAFFIDLNNITADKYDAIGDTKVKNFFPGDHTHTNEAGARINAQSVITGLRMQPKCGLYNFLQFWTPVVFSDNMILQREKKLVIWGRAKPLQEVQVIFNKQQKSTQSEADGNWKLYLDPMKSDTTNRSLTIVAGKSDTISFQNILVGDVWLCSGQSNMEYTFDRKLKKYATPKRGVDIQEQELTNMNKSTKIRYLYVERIQTKLPYLPSIGWVNASDTLLNYVSAIGYFFAKEIEAKTGVPIGIISSSWGGTRIEPWIPDWAYEHSAVLKDSVTGPNFKVDGVHPGQMFNSMIQPMLPLNIKGMLWYQGESDLNIHDHKTYPAKFELLVDTYRDLYGDKKMPVYYVEIAPHLYSKRKDPLPHDTLKLPEFWEAQTKSLSLKNTGMVVTTDLVDNPADIHPPYKWEVAHRLALQALAKDYGEKKTVYSGPAFKSMNIKNDKIQLSFDDVGSGLKSSDGKDLNWFAIAGADGVFAEAKATIVGKKIELQSLAVKNPTQVRFAWHETAQPNLINAEGLPALPFRTGN